MALAKGVYTLFTIILLVVGLNYSRPASAQLWNANSDFLIDRDRAGGRLLTGLGWTRITANGKGSVVNYATISLYPEFTMAKLRAGLAIDLLVNMEDDPGGNRIKRADLKAGHLFRYVRYGDLSEPLYLHAGALERVFLGNGFIVSRYSNQIADQKRRTGLWFRVDGVQGGIEGFLSNVGTREIYGARAFIRPLRGRLSKLTFGVTIVIDDNPSRGRTVLPSLSAEVVGADISYPIEENLVYSLIGYGDFAKLLDSGRGGALGIRLEVPKFLGLFSLTARLEQHFLGAGFVPAFFDETYEVTSIQADGQSKMDQFRSLPASRGTLGAFEAMILNRLKIMASYRTLYGRNAEGIFHGEAHLIHTIPKLSIRAVYDKQGVGSLTDLRKLDNRSIAQAEATYRIYQNLLLGFEYRWTFAFDENPNVYTFRPLERFTAKLMFETVF